MKQKTVCSLALALAAALFAWSASAATFDDIQFWTGSGPNRAALVFQWNSPEVFNTTTVPAPVVNRSMAWGYRFNEPASVSQMISAILAADLRLFAVDGFGGGVFLAFGYELNNNGVFDVTDGTNTYHATNVTAGRLSDPSLAADGSRSTDDGDLSCAGGSGPNWLVWHEQGRNGGFTNAPDRGSNPYWTSNPRNE